MKTVWILSVAVVLTVSAAFAAYAMDLHRMALWQVVRACVADYKLTGTPFPCLEVDLSGGEERGTVVLRPPLLEDTVLTPTRRIKGIEDPFLQSPEAPNYFDAAWRARTFLKNGDGQAPERLSRCANRERRVLRDRFCHLKSFGDKLIRGDDAVHEPDLVRTLDGHAVPS